MRRVLVLLIATIFSWPVATYAQSFVLDNRSPGAFPIVTLPSSTGRSDTNPLTSVQSAGILVSPEDDWLVHQAAKLLQQDIQMVTGQAPEIMTSLPTTPGKNFIIIGTVGGCKWIDSLAAAHRLDIDSVKGKWEAFSIAALNGPNGFSNTLVIAGSDKRGAAYGVFELSRQMGVSPWYWWADVPPRQHKELFVKKGNYYFESPSVKYRGIFINDEAPAFSGWTKEKFGGVNHLVYEKIFELLLRLKANYLWPAMWGNAFNDDDTLNPVLANKWGIVMGTSHHEPMLRAQQEWKRYGHGRWDYTTNDSVLRAFWKKGIQNMDHHESIVTIGMRGDGDEPMTAGTATRLLENIVADQRKIIEDVTGKPAAQTPQLWALYKEVQDYYDKGMRVPDDVTLLLCDDNWGNIRRLPKPTDPPRTGGYGIYYHFDYVGDPRNYKWLNTNNIARVWEQMHLAYESGVQQIWIVNVGDLKPMEFPISFFLDYAWNVKKYNADNLPDYFTHWAAEQFGPEHALAIGKIIQQYSQYNARRKPELLDADTYPLSPYSEATMVTYQWDKLLQQAEKINAELSAKYKDAYFELVLHPVTACANLQHLYTAVALNHRFARENSPVANKYAEQAKEFYLHDSIISRRYNQLAGGKWDHMMDQTHIGYTYWQQPLQQKMPELVYVPEDSSHPSASIQGSAPAGLSHPTSVRWPLPAKPAYHEHANVPANAEPNSFFELSGYISLDAAHATRKASTKDIVWKVIPGIGSDGDGITTFPVTATLPSNDQGPRLEYDIYTYDTGSIKLHAYFSPTLNVHHDSEGLQYAIAIDDQQPQIVSINKEDANRAVWNKWVADNIIIATTSHAIGTQGRHVIKYWPLNSAIIFQKMVIDLGGLPPSYLGPPETITHKKSK
jgi:hypothetical protein